MKILVTGGAGFIASHIVDACLFAGHEVHIVDDFSTGKEENINPDAQFFEMDITDVSIRHLMADQRYKCVIHHAAQLDVRKSVSDPAFDANVNVVGTLNLLQAGLENGLEKFIFASSGGTVYGEQEYFPADEKHPIRPISPYGVAKASVEHYLHYYKEIQGLDYVSLRYANIYGPRQNPHGEAGVVAIFANKMLLNEQPVINGDGLQTRDYVFVSDVVQANMLALEYAGSGCFNIGTGIETNVVELFDQVNEFFGGKFERKFGEAKAGEQKRSVLSHGLIKEKMGWAPEYNFKDGMQETLSWFKERFDSVKEEE